MLGQSKGYMWALISPLFLGITPIIAKLAYQQNLDIWTVTAFRTLWAAGLLWLVMALFFRQYITLPRPAVWLCLAVGGINGLGSLFYYYSLGLIDASLGQLINITYLLQVTVILRVLGQPISRLTLFRMGLALTAVYLLTAGQATRPDWLGISLMFFAATTYAIKLVVSQKVLQNTPAESVTLYVMSGMAMITLLPWLWLQPPAEHITWSGWWLVFLMGGMTALARLTMFLGVKGVGSLQTALIGVAELIVTVTLAWWFLQETLTLTQWGGAGLLVFSLLLVKYDRAPAPAVELSVA